MTALKNKVVLAFAFWGVLNLNAQFSQKIKLRSLEKSYKTEEKYILCFEKGKDTFCEKGSIFHPVVRIPNLHLFTDTLYVFANKKLIYIGVDSSSAIITLKLHRKKNNTLSVFRVREKRMLKFNLDPQFNSIHLLIDEEKDHKKDSWYIIFKSSINPYPH